MRTLARHAQILWVATVVAVLAIWRIIEWMT